MTDNQSQETQTQMSSLALDFKKYGKVVTWQEMEEFEEARRRSLTEPPEITFLCGSDIPVIMPLQVIQQIIEDEIEKIEENFMIESIKEEEANAGQLFPMLPAVSHDNLIATKNVVKRNPFDWTIEIQHEMPEREEGWNDAVYEVMIQQKELHGKIEVRIYANKENKSFEKFYVYINRLSGRTPVYYDFRSSLIKKLKEKEIVERRFILRKGLIMLMEGTAYKEVKEDEEDEEEQESEEYKETHITRYLFDEMIVREICSFIPEDDKDKQQNKDSRFY
jgi:hypothetical protein